jgi:hypothetical protein
VINEHSPRANTANTLPEHLLRLPVPEKAQKQYNFCLIPTTGRGMDDKAPREGPIAEPLLWTVNDGAPLQIQIFDADMRNAIDKSDRIVEAALEYAMRENKTKVTYPDEAEFVSATPEAHRKGEKAYHVKAFKGSKEGMKRATLQTLPYPDSHHRLPLLPFKRCLFRLQEASPVLPVG